MFRALCLSFFVVALGAYAQTPEPPVEKASFTTVLVFLVLFIGSCVGYVVYTLWMARKKSDEKEVR